MTEQQRNTILSRWRQGASLRRLARELHLSRHTVERVVTGVEAQRAGLATPRPRRAHGLDAYETVMHELLARYPDLTGVRLFEELRQQGYPGSYSTVRLRLRELRPRTAPRPEKHYVTTDAEGNYRLRSILKSSADGKAVRIQLVVTKEGFAGKDTHPFRFEPAGDAPQVAAPVRLRPGFTVRGTVVDPGAEPVAGAWVELAGSYADGAQFTRTDDAGRFIVRDLPEGMVSLSFRYGQFMAQGEYLAERDPQPVTVRLQPLPDPAQRKPTAEAAKVASPKPLAVGTPAPEWDAGSWSDGRSRKLADYRGKIVFLDFWGIWCGPCVHALPTIEKVRSKYEPRGVVFLSLHTPGEEEQKVRRLLELKKVSLVFAFDRDGQKGDHNRYGGVTAERYGINGYPSYVLIDGAGKVAFHSDGPAAMLQFRAMLKEFGFNEETAIEDQATQMIERFLERSIEKVLASR